MRTIERDTHNSLATVELSQNELITIANALNEVLNGLALNEFGSRIGAPKGVVEDLLHQVRSLAKEFPRPSW